MVPNELIRVTQRNLGGRPFLGTPVGGVVQSHELRVEDPLRSLRVLVRQLQISPHPPVIIKPVDVGVQAGKESMF